MAKRRSKRSEPDLEDDDDDEFAWQPKAKKKKKKKRAGSTSSAGKSAKRKKSGTSTKRSGSSVNRSGRRKSKRVDDDEDGGSSRRRRSARGIPPRKKQGNPVLLISIVTVTILICLIVVVSSGGGGTTGEGIDEPRQMELADELAKEGMTAFHQWNKAVRGEGNPGEENRLNRLARRKLTEAMDTLNSALDPYRDSNGYVKKEWEGWEIRLGDWSKYLIDLEKGARTDAGH